MSRLCFSVDMEEMEQGVSVNCVGVHPLTWHKHPAKPKYGYFPIYDDNLRQVAELICYEGMSPTAAVEQIYQNVIQEE